MKSIHAIVSGRVQGVCFRYYTCMTARELGVSGWVRNLRDGRVELRAQGGEDALASLEKWLQHGPPAADVTNLQILEDAESVQNSGFEIV